MNDRGQPNSSAAPAETGRCTPVIGFQPYDGRVDEIVPASPADAIHPLAGTPEGTPLIEACREGWYLLNPTPFMAIWYGGNSIDSIRMDYLGDARGSNASSHFGYGIVTWNPRLLFHTPPGWNLVARGPANWPKRGITALEGIVETDWADATFTMNWQMTEPGFPVVFEAGEPYCLLMPVRRGSLERFAPAISVAPASSGASGS